MRGYCKALVLSIVLLVPVSIIFSGYDSNLSNAFFKAGEQQKVEGICTVLNLIKTWDFTSKNMQRLYVNARWSWDKKVFSRINKIVDSIDTITVTQFHTLNNILTNLETKFNNSQNQFSRKCLSDKHKAGALLCKKLQSIIVNKSNGYAVAQLMQEQVNLQHEQRTVHNELQAKLAYLSPENLEKIKNNLIRDNAYIKKTTQSLRAKLDVLKQKIGGIGTGD